MLQYSIFISAPLVGDPMGGALTDLWRPFSARLRTLHCNNDVVGFRLFTFWLIMPVHIVVVSP